MRRVQRELSTICKHSIRNCLSHHGSRQEFTARSVTKATALLGTVFAHHCSLSIKSVSPIRKSCIWVLVWLIPVTAKVFLDPNCRFRQCVLQLSALCAMTQERQNGEAESEARSAHQSVWREKIEKTAHPVQTLIISLIPYLT